MNAPLKALLVAAAASVVPVAAGAVNYVDNFVIGLDTEEITAGRGLARGDTWTSNYTLAANVPPFILNLNFGGNAPVINVLSNVRFGIGSATTEYTTITNNPVGAGRIAAGFIDEIEITGPFSIVYSHLNAGANRTAQVNYTGLVEFAPTAVPEIGAEGALSAMLLVMGGIAVMAGTRRRGDSVTLT